MGITPYIHRCTISSGDMEGSKTHHVVQPYDVEYKTTCDECGEILATPEQITAHIYEQLLNPD